MAKKSRVVVFVNGSREDVPEKLLQKGFAYVFLGAEDYDRIYSLLGEGRINPSMDLLACAGHENFVSRFRFVMVEGVTA